MKQFIVFSALVAMCTATFPLTFTSGSTAYVLSAAGTTNAAIGLALLGITKIAVLGAIAASRSKRSVGAPIDFTQMFEGIDAQDQYECGKLMTCYAFAKNPEKLTEEERAVIGLFDDLANIQPNAYGKFQWAAYTGTFKNPVVCHQRYNSCPVSAEKLSNLVSVRIN